MPSIFKTLISISVWLLFIKGILISLVTFYTMGRAYLAGEATPMAGVAGCAAGTFAFAMASVSAWIRHKVESPGPV